MEWSNRYVVIDKSFRILVLEKLSFDILSSIASIVDLIWPLRPGSWISMDEPTTLIYVAGELERGERFPQWLYGCILIMVFLINSFMVVSSTC